MNDELMAARIQAYADLHDARRALNRVCRRLDEFSAGDLVTLLGSTRHVTEAITDVEQRVEIRRLVR